MSVILTAVPPFINGPCAGETSLLVAYQAILQAGSGTLFYFYMSQSQTLLIWVINLCMRPATEVFLLAFALISGFFAKV